ncbi:fatty-acid--CoA ligase [Streptomyces albus]|uniref:Fatty-acid--CoA ligase n=1 Tax=Streptomyces albus (strain ATCC 21838 / DSM 41398 / FERM P-419 / JCM 4703 / NBRC 107858) TaxID=1081613 RepID=A0A0B5F9W5_STRA4|nr:fatty-acid--CoA ligase [Streptomyces albus]AOU81580.1 fatty-acid--CoA ligase [Streptomyces albus]AYN37272.1 fatty-acid--CoA ligase [Streptomyces albus]
MSDSSPALRVQDRYDEPTISEFRASRYWRDDVLSERIDHWAEETPERVLVTDGYGSLTARSLRDKAYRLAASLRGLGVASGDRVQVQLPNWNEFVIAYVAITRIGAILVPTMPIYRHDEVRHVLQHSGARVSIVPEEFRKFDYRAMLEEIRPDCPDLQHVITVRSTKGQGLLRFEDLTSGPEPTPGELGEPPSPDAPHCIIYTSGTESRPKGCLHTMNTVSFTVYALGADVMKLGVDDVMFMPSPITHATGLAMGVTAPLFLGSGIHLMDVWEAKEGLRRVAEYRCTATMTATPFVHMALEAVLKSPESAELLASLSRWACAGAPIPESLLHRWSERLSGCALLPVYGRSEGLLVTACSMEDSPEQVLSSDGRALDGVVLEIRGEDGRLREAGEEGEIWHGGPGLMLGYWNDPERTAASIDARGISATGDLGRVDSKGYLRVTGRIKDLIIRGGTNISAAEVENHLLTHPRVAQAAVVAAPDKRLGEKACAFIVPRGQAPTLAELTAYLRDERRIAVQKLPEMLQIVPELPTTSTGKVQKFVLRDIARGIAEKPE